MDQRYLETLTSVFKHLGINISSLTEKWKAVYRKETLHCGHKFATKYLKDLNTIGERVALGQPITPLPFRKSDKDGIPRDLAPFRRYLKGTALQKAAALSVLRAVESCRTEISKDISTVTQPSTADPELVDSICAYAKVWVKGLNLKLKLKKLKYHWTLKNGPNGPALKTSDSDVGALYTDMVLFGAIQTVSAKLGDKYPIRNTYRHKPGGIHSKLTQFPEKAGKTRTIAIIDYYSQRALNPLHSGLMEILRSLESDGTYSHRNVGIYAKQATESCDYIACYDLSAFTDRFPAKIQYALLHALLEEEPDLAEAFWTLLAKRQFTVAWSGEQVTYQCGQPMGAYASWPLCSLAHHLVVEYKSKTGVKDKYRLIGDDVIITDEPLARNYFETIKRLGVEVNLSKTVVTEAHRPRAAEVAKQLFYEGKSITPVTPGLVKSLRNPMLIPMALEDLAFKLDIKLSTFPPVLLKSLLPRKESLSKALVLLTNPLTGPMREVVNDSDANTELVEFIQPFTDEWVQFDMEDVKDNFYEYRYESLLEIASEYSMLGADWQPGTGPLEAQAFASMEIATRLTDAQDILEELMYDDFEDDNEGVTKFDKLLEVEYLPNPENPFKDRKETRDIRRSTIILEVAKLLGYEAPVPSTC